MAGASLPLELGSNQKRERATGICISVVRKFGSTDGNRAACSTHHDTTPDISILSDEFLVEVQAMDRPNLALEALRKLIAGEVRSKARTNVVETRAFSERLDAAIARYHSNALTTAEVL
jgi:type I site-specific restriction-modification system R (restriction) subunit